MGQEFESSWVKKVVFTRHQHERTWQNFVSRHELCHDRVTGHSCMSSRISLCFSSFWMWCCVWSKLQGAWMKDWRSWKWSWRWWERREEEVGRTWHPDKKIQDIPVLHAAITCFFRDAKFSSGTIYWRVLIENTCHIYGILKKFLLQVGKN